MNIGGQIAHSASWFIWDCIGLRSLPKLIRWQDTRMHRQLIALGALTIALAALLAPLETAAAQTRTVPAQRLVCESDLNREALCRADTRNGVALVRSFGRERCVIGRNWGYDRDGIWVSDGCKAEFAIGSSGNGYGWGWGNRFTGYVYCESVESRRNQCAINARGGVRLINQVSRAACVEGRTWGFSDHAIWVSGGCRGEFEVKLGGPDVPPPRPIPTPGPSPAEARVLCESLDGRDRFCRLPIDADRVVLDRQISRSPCVEGRTWGYRQAGIYVTSGCRAEFRVLDYRGDRSRNSARGRDRRSDGRGEDIERLTCASDDGRREYCNYPNQGVRMVEQLSRAPCIEERTFGRDRNGVWVDRGCSAVFDVRDHEGRRYDRDGERDWDDRDDRNYDND